MDKWHGKVAIVTGASSGIGAATAWILAKHGLLVVAVARREDRLKELSDKLSNEGGLGKIYIKKTDLQKEEEIVATFEWVEEELGGADILVNNAGVYFTGFLSEGKLEDWRTMFDINVLAVTICTQLFLKSMERRSNQTGHIIIVNSVAGQQAEYAQSSIYCGTKFAIKAISMCLRRELAEKNSTIKVTSVSPGPVATEIFKGTHLDEMIKTIPILSGEDVAAAIVDALSASPVSEICEIVLNPVPTKLGVY